MKVDTFVALSEAQKINFDPKTEDQKKLKEQTDQFEAFLIKKVLDISLKREDSIFGKKDAGSKIYNSMYNDTISRAMGGGFGFSQMLFDYLTQDSNISKKTS